MNHLVLPDLRLTPVLDQVLEKQPLQSLGPLILAAEEKEQIELVRRQFYSPQPTAGGAGRPHRQGSCRSSSSRVALWH